MPARRVTVPFCTFPVSFIKSSSSFMLVGLGFSHQGHYMVESYFPAFW